jgi:hypothetical protein
LVKRRIDAAFEEKGPSPPFRAFALSDRRALILGLSNLHLRQQKILFLQGLETKGCLHVSHNFVTHNKVSGCSPTFRCEEGVTSGAGVSSVSERDIVQILAFLTPSSGHRIKTLSCFNEIPETDGLDGSNAFSCSYWCSSNETLVGDDPVGPDVLEFLCALHETEQLVGNDLEVGRQAPVLREDLPVVPGLVHKRGRQEQHGALGLEHQRQQ